MNPVETITPPNVHVIAGKTATGKTAVLRRLAKNWVAQHPLNHVLIAFWEGGPWAYPGVDICTYRDTPRDAQAFAAMLYSPRILVLLDTPRIANIPVSWAADVARIAQVPVVYSYQLPRDYQNQFPTHLYLESLSTTTLQNQDGVVTALSARTKFPDNDVFKAIQSTLPLDLATEFRRGEDEDF